MRENLCTNCDEEAVIYDDAMQDEDPTTFSAEFLANVDAQKKAAKVRPYA